MGRSSDALGGLTVKALVFVFFSLFAVPGLICVAVLAYYFWMWAETDSWIRSSCSIDSAEVETGHGEDGDLYKTAVRYHYEFRGQTYQGKRLALMEGASSGRASHEKRAAELQHHLRSGTPRPCLVNAVTPTESLLYRELEVLPLLMLTLFGVVFSWIGIGGFYGAFFGARKNP